MQKNVFNQDKQDFFKTDTGLELAQAYLEDEEKMLDKEFAKIVAKGEEIEERRREVKENLAKVKMDKGKNVSNPT